MVLLNEIGVVGFLVGNSISSFTLDLKVDCMSVPVVYLGGHSIHGVDSFHEQNRDFS